VPQLATQLDGSGTLVVLDTAPVVGVAVAAELCAQKRARPVIVLGRWPYAEAVLPARPLVDVLLSEAVRLRTVGARDVVLVLDGERSRPVTERSPGDRRTDNRYAFDPNDLPDPATLRALRIERVLAIDCGVDVVTRYRQAGLPVIHRGPV
jgi:hypothetical protein